MSYVIGPLDHQAIYESDVWNVFHSMGLGYSVFHIHPSNGPTLWCTPPTANYCQFHTDADIIDVLIKNNLVQRVERENLPYGAECYYKLTEKGQGVYTEISSKMFQEGFEMFKSKVGLVQD